MKKVSKYALGQTELSHSELHQNTVYAHSDMKENFGYTSGLINDAVNDSQGVQKTKVYKRRWYILMVYCLLAFTQAALWNTWGPIAASSEKAFGWSVTILALLPNWGPIGFIPTVLFFSWLVDVKGLRLACLVTAVLVAMASAIRCVSSEPPYVTWTVNTGQLLNGFAGPVSKGAAPVLSSLWFPQNQRTTATAISVVANSLGIAVSFLIGPYMVPESKAEINNLYSNSTNMIDIHSINGTENNATRLEGDLQEIARIRKDIMVMNYVECGWSVIVFILVVVYFPDKPGLPPSMKASVERLDFKAGFKGLIRNKRFWMLCVTFGVPLGVLGFWQGILDVVLKPHGVSEKQAGWMGFYSLLAGNAAAVVIARFADVFSKHMKLFLIALYVGAAVCFLWFILVLMDLFQSSIAQIYSSIIIGTLFMNASPPLFFEMVSERTYPIAEGITNFALALMFNIAGLVFLLIQMIPGIGTVWTNWFLLVSIVLSIPVLFAMDDTYNRLGIDEQRKPETSRSA